MTDPIPVRILVVGDIKVGKSLKTLIRALCPSASSPSLPGCSISVRPSEDGKCIEEFYDVTGDPRFSHGRGLFFSLRSYDAVIFVYDATDYATRSSVSCTWVPEVMRHLGDVGALESGGRLDGTDLHVRSIGVVNELRYLWRHTFFSYSAISVREAFADTGHLLMRFFKLWLNETGLWPDPSIDRQAEVAFLSTSAIPVAIASMKTDLINKEDLSFSEQSEPPPRGITYLQLHKRNVPHDPRLRAFLGNAADAARRKTPPSKSNTNSSNTGQIMLSFM